MAHRIIVPAGLALACCGVALAGPPRLLPHEVPTLVRQCGAMNPAYGVAKALGEDGSVAGEANCGIVTYGSATYYVSPEGALSEFDDGNFSFTSVDFIVGVGRAVGTGDWCPPQNGACTTAVVLFQVGGPLAIVASNAASASFPTHGNMNGWVSGYGSISPSNAWRIRPDGTLESLTVAGAFGVSSKHVNASGTVAGSAYVSNQMRAIRWSPSSTVGTPLPSVVAGTAASAVTTAVDGSVAGQSGGVAAMWNPAGIGTALMPAGSASEVTHIAGNPSSASPLPVAYFGTHAHDTKLFRAEVGSWQDLTPQPNAGDSFIMGHIVAAPRQDMMVASMHNQMYQNFQFLWTQQGGLGTLKSFVVNLPAGVGDLIAVDANASGQILVNSTLQHKTYILQALAEGDTNGDGQVDGADLGQVLGAWGPVAAGVRGACDFNGDQVVDGADLGTVLGTWTK